MSAAGLKEAVRQRRGSLMGIGRQIMNVAFGVLEVACFLSTLQQPVCYCLSDPSASMTDSIKGPWCFSPDSQASFTLVVSLFHFYLIARVSSPLFSPPFVPPLMCSSFVTSVCHSPPTVLIPRRDASQCAKCISNFLLLLGNYAHTHTYTHKTIFTHPALNKLVQSVFKQRTQMNTGWTCQPLLIFGLGFQSSL